MNYSVNYKISINNSKFAGYQEKKGNNGTIKLFVSVIFEDSKDFEDFIDGIIYFTIHERICLERAFNKIRIQGGMCNPCCVKNLAIEMYKSIME